MRERQKALKEGLKEGPVAVSTVPLIITAGAFLREAMKQKAFTAAS